MTTNAAGKATSMNWAEREALRLRSEADRLDRLARAAEVDGDTWDAADLQAKARELRRSARRIEVK